MKRYEFPQSLSSNARTLAADARALVEATSRLTDQKVAAARRRLQAALEAGEETFHYVENKMIKGARVADRAVQRHPYRGMLIAFGIGIFLGFGLRRPRD
jgi:ElaB/YqjD/DUF883 family membrane-anchored ribosome-binding protein